MVGRERNTDAGIGGQLMADAFERRADRFKRAGHEVDDVDRCLDAGLHDRELVAAQSRDEAGGADALVQIGGDGLEQLVADQMAERVVDALELVDIDVIDRKLLASRDLRQLRLQPLVEQRAVRQVGQRVEMGEVGDALLGAPALGDVFVGGDPAAVGQRLVHDLHRTAVGRLDDDGLLAGRCRAASPRCIRPHRRRTSRSPCGG